MDHRDYFSDLARQPGNTALVDSYCGLREPNCPISSGAYRVHGLSREDLAGRRLDTARIKEMIDKADFLVAHNASFDKGFVTRLFPSAKAKPWYCSMSGVWWAGSRALQALLDEHGIVPVSSSIGRWPMLKALLLCLTVKMVWIKHTLRK